MELADRFRYIMKLNQMSASAFADEIGVQRSSISHILSGRNKPSLEFIQKVLKRFPKVDANWLINGTTSIDKSEISPSTGLRNHPSASFGGVYPEQGDALSLSKGRRDQDRSLGNQDQKSETESSASLEINESDKESNDSQLAKAVRVANKSKIKKIVVFYEDQTFEEFNP